MHTKPSTLRFTAALTLFGCGVGPANPIPTAVEAAPPRVLTPDQLNALPSEAQLTLDLRKPQVLLIDAEHNAMDFNRVTLICPTGQTMNMAIWLRLPSFSLDIDLAHARFSVIPVSVVVDQCRPGNADPQCKCNQKCFLCTDGAWVCADPCQPEPGTNHGPREWLPSYGEEPQQDPHPPVDPGPLPGPIDPVDPGDPLPPGGGGEGGGGGGGTGGGGGGSGGGGSGGGGSGGGGGGGGGSSESGSGSGHAGGGTPAGGGLGGGL